MGLSAELISEFVKITNDNKKSRDGNTVYGTVKSFDEDSKTGMVKIDGSNELTPFTTTCTVTGAYKYTDENGEEAEYEGDRVRLNIRNHNAIVTGNTTDISASAAELLEALAKIVKLEKQGVTFDSVVKFVNGLENGTTTIDGGRIKTGSISFDRLNSDAKNKIDGAVSDAEDALNAANGVDETLAALLDEDDDTTYIDGSKILTGSIYADKIHLGGKLTVYTSKKGTYEGGYLGYDDGFNSSEGIGIRDASEVNQVVCTDEAARLSSGDPSSSTDPFAQVVTIVAWDDDASAYRGRLLLEAKHALIVKLNKKELIAFSNHSTYYSFRPQVTDGKVYLGNATYRWGGIYANNVYNSSGELTTSDRDAKNNIENLPDKYVDMFDRLRPVRFKFNDGTSDRYHTGYIAQEVEEAMIASGIDSKEFGGFAREFDDDGNALCMLRYGEFDAIYAAKIKQLESRIDELERRLANIETKEVG